MDNNYNGNYLAEADAAGKAVTGADFSIGKDPFAINRSELARLLRKDQVEAKARKMATGSSKLTPNTASGQRRIASKRK